MVLCPGEVTERELAVPARGTGGGGALGVSPSGSAPACCRGLGPRGWDWDATPQPSLCPRVGGNGLPSTSSQSHQCQGRTLAQAGPRPQQPPLTAREPLLWPPCRGQRLLSVPRVLAQLRSSARFQSFHGTSACHVELCAPPGAFRCGASSASIIQSSLELA